MIDYNYPLSINFSKFILFHFKFKSRIHHCHTLLEEYLVFCVCMYVTLVVRLLFVAIQNKITLKNVIILFRIWKCNCNIHILLFFLTNKKISKYIILYLIKCA